VVVTAFNPDYPMIRLATGDLSMLMAGRSPCGRSNVRLAGWMGRADQTTKIKGMFVHPAQVAEVGKRTGTRPAPTRGEARRPAGRDEHCLAESASASDGLPGAIRETLQSLTKLRGEVALVPPGALPNDGKVIADERPIG